MKTMKKESNSAGRFRRFYFALLTAGILLFGPGLFAQTNTESEILSLSKEKFQWQNEGKFDKIASLLDKNAVVVQSDGSIHSKKDYLNYLKRGGAANIIEVKGALVRVNGSTATVVGKARIDNSGNDNSNALSYTEVYALENNMWKLVVQHSTSISN